MAAHLDLDVIPAVASSFALLIAPAARLVWQRLRRRARRRNDAEQCAHCGLPWSEIGLAVNEFFVDGARTCAPCAQRLRRRIVIEASALVLTTSLVSGVTYSALLRYWRGTPWWGLVWLAAPPILLASATALALRAMKRRNRDLMNGPTGKAPLSEQTTQRNDAVVPSHDRPFESFAPAI